MTDTMDNKTIMLMLYSGQSPDRQVVSNQETALTILKANNITYETLDAALPENKDHRNELFDISGIRAKYPQFFIVNNGETTFWGNWEHFDNANEQGTLVTEFNSAVAAQAEASSSSATATTTGAEADESTTKNEPTAPTTAEEEG